MTTAATVLIRTRDEASNIGRVLDLVAEQRLRAGAVQVVVVDSGSRDGTPDIARRHGAEVIEIPAASFTFGRSLNMGAQRARAPVVVALSADAFPGDPAWLERMLDALADPGVCCATAAEAGPDGRPLTGPVRQDAALARAHPFWGYSNAAGAFRADLWRRRPFREDLTGCEDKEWALHWLERGYVAVVDPALAVEHALLQRSFSYAYRRGRREWEGFGAYLNLPPMPPAQLARAWWSDTSDFSSPWRARADPWRAAFLLGRFVGTRRAAA